MAPKYLHGLVVLDDNHGYRSRRPDERPRRGRLDVGLHYEIPGPGVLADRLALPLLAAREVEVFKHEGNLATRPAGTHTPPSPVATARLVEDLAAAIRALPDQPGAGRQYRDLRTFATEAAPSTLRDYLADVVLATRRRAPRWRAPAPTIARTSPAKSGRERVAEHRRRAADQEMSTARWWIENYLAGWDTPDEAPTPGERVRSTDLYALAIAGIEGHLAEVEDYLADGEEWEEIAAAEGYPASPLRLPGRTRFYAVADALLGPRRRSHGVTYYTIPADRHEATTAP